MITIDTTYFLVAKMGEALTTTQPDYAVFWGKRWGKAQAGMVTETYDANVSTGSMNSTTNVTIMSKVTPATSNDRIGIKGLVFCNRDTVAHTFFVSLATAATGGTEIRLVNNVSVAANCMLVYDENGWRVEPDSQAPNVTTAVGVLPAVNGGTGVANGASCTLTLPNAATTITGGGTIALGGFTVTVGRAQTFTAPTTADALADVMIGASATTQTPLKLQAKAGQSARIMEWQTSAGAVGGYIAANADDMFSNLFRSNKFEANGWNAIESGATGGYGLGSANIITWSSSASTTSVSGGDTGLARSAAGVIKATDGSTGIRGFLGGGASVASDTAMPLPTGRVFHVTGTNNITSITSTNFQAGAVITLIFDDVLTFTDGNNLKLAGNFTTSADDTITLAYDGTNWYECCRSAN